MGSGQRVGARIRALRKRRRLTQEDLAGLIDRSVETVSAMERGMAFPGFVTLERLAHALNVPIADFFDAPGRPGESANRAGLLARILDAARNLSDPLLRIAVEQIEVLERSETR